MKYKISKSELRKFVDEGKYKKLPDFIELEVEEATDCCPKCIKHPKSDLVCKGFCPCHKDTKTWEVQHIQEELGITEEKCECPLLPHTDECEWKCNKPESHLHKRECILRREKYPRLEKTLEGAPINQPCSRFKTDGLCSHVGCPNFIEKPPKYIDWCDFDWSNDPEKDFYRLQSKINEILHKLNGY